MLLSVTPDSDFETELDEESFPEDLLKTLVVVALDTFPEL